MAGNPEQNQQRINEMCDWLLTTATAADNHFWDGIVAEYRVSGAISAYIRNTSDAMCDVEAVADQILQEFAEMLNQTHVPVDWASNKTALTPTNASYAGVRLKTVASDILEQLSAPPPVTNRTGFDAALDDLYAHASTIINALGPKFASPLTTAYPNADAMMITAEVDGSGVLILTLKDGSETPTAWPVGAAWHQLAAGDLIYVEALAVTGFEAFVGQTLEIDSFAGTDSQMKFNTGASLVAAADSAFAVLPGDVFRLRKVKGA